MWIEVALVLYAVVIVGFPSGTETEHTFFIGLLFYWAVLCGSSKYGRGEGMRKIGYCHVAGQKVLCSFIKMNTRSIMK
jgi:hypothetical protein